MEFPNLSTGSGLNYQKVCEAYPRGLPKLTEAGEKRVVFMTSVRISDDQIWSNGLFQNVYIIYKLFEAMGCFPIILIDSIENNKNALVHKTFRMTDFKKYMEHPHVVHAYIEMAMSCSPEIRKWFRNMGAKVSKLYMGNILNIDIETVAFYKQVNFAHHVAGELDEIWVSPHYDQHAEYAGCINGICDNVRIAPYLWDPMFINQAESRYDGSNLDEGSPRLFVIMEPNISFQKNSLIPIMALEAYYRKWPSRVDTIVVVNGDKLKQVPWFTDNIAPSLKIVQDGKLQLMPRAHMHNAVKVFKNAIVLQHQVNNQYNYSTLEWLHLGFPLIHNVSRFKNFGYYYEDNDFYGASEAIEKVVKRHNSNLSTYAAQASQLTWSFSINNPANIKEWEKITFMKVV
jgi:hypothetical protein